MWKRHWLDAVAATLFLIGVSDGAFGETITDEFSAFNGHIWQAGSYGNPGPFTVETLNGELRLKKETASGGSPVKGGGLYSKFILSGDFQITVDFRWSIYSENNQAQINLSSVTAGFFYDMGTGKGVDVPTGQRLYYNFIPSDGYLRSAFRVNTNDDSGTLRVERIGNAYRAYYSSDGSNFTQIPGTRYLTTGDLRFSLILQNNNIDNVAEVFFDNLEVVADQILCTGNCVMPGEVMGQVTADCPQAAVGLLGVTVDAYEVGSGDLVGSATTDEDGGYSINDLLPGEYSITAVVPLGYSTPINDIPVSVPNGGMASAFFGMACVSASGDPRGSGFWKHQVGVATGGRGAAQIEAADLCSYLDLIEMHFNDNVVNEVAIYDPPESDLCSDKLAVAEELLNLRGNVGVTARARQAVATLLLNVAAGHLHLAEVISTDGATVSQAITYCDSLLDNPQGDHQTARSVATIINEGGTVGAGSIPLNTADIAYKGQGSTAPLRFHLAQNEPNPFNPRTAIRFTLPEASEYKLSIFDIAGRRVREYDGVAERGQGTVVWDGRDTTGSRVGSGLYFYRLRAGDVSATKRMVLMK